MKSFLCLIWMFRVGKQQKIAEILPYGRLSTNLAGTKDANEALTRDEQ